MSTFAEVPTSLSALKQGSLFAAHKLFSERALNVSLAFCANWSVLFVAESTCELLGVAAKALTGLEARMVLGEESANWLASQQELLVKGNTIEHQLTLTAGEACIPAQVRVFWDTVTQVFWVCGFDVSEFQRVEQELKHLATHDSLTGLPNKTLLHERIRWHLEEAARNSSRFAVAVMDLDGFKKVNDALGHLSGDLLLKEASQRIKGCIREVDGVSRTGGDEFVLVFPDVRTLASAQTLCERIVEAIRKPIALSGQDVFVSTSVGVALYPEHGSTVGELLQHADMAMYSAKQQGKNRVGVYAPEMSFQAEALSLESSMHAGIRDGEFNVEYQPVVDASTHRIRGFEALLRWRRNGSEVIPPGKFIPLAENNGLITVLGDYVLRSATMQLRRLQSRGFKDLYVSVNVSPRQLRSPNFDKSLQKILAVTGIEPHQLVLEITESILMHEPQKTQSLLRQISETGVRFSLDDFGTGYSCLAYLKTYPISILKVDRSFVQDIVDDPVSPCIVKAIIDLAKALKVASVVEGVESLEQAELLARLGADHLQGFRFSAPMSADMLHQWLVDNSSMHKG